MSENPYLVLGVGKRASSATIEKAYRKLAKRLHPDVNKSPEAGEQFKRVHRAYRILIDPELRTKYDATGNADPDTPDNRTAIIATVLTKTFNMTVEEVSKNGRSLETVNLVEQMKINLRSVMDRMEETLVALSKRKQSLENAKPRIKVRHKGGANILQRIAEEAIAQVVTAIKVQERELDHAKLGLEALNNYSFDIKQSSPPFTRPSITINFFPA